MKTLTLLLCLPATLFSQSGATDQNNQRFVIYEVRSIGRPQIFNSVEEAVSDSAIAYNQVGDGTIILKLDTKTGDTWILGSIWFAQGNSDNSTAIYNWLMVQHAPYIGKFKERKR